MKVDVPRFVYQLPPGRLVATLIGRETFLFLREEEWGMTKYPRRCDVEPHLATFSQDGVILAVLLLRLARSDQTTYECWLNLADPTIVRTIQGLADQPQLDLHVVTDLRIRSIRTTNPLRADAAELVDTVRKHPAWTREDFETVFFRIVRLYPTAQSLWWSSCMPSGRHGRGRRFAPARRRH